ncbi:MAG: DUF2085 domain-containing protein [Candidatus Burarchaeum sp.]|nr:DUF2085 domain-containing protein [Candidatus Burarchaeum sp.]MDO8339789.1 DUF2085 domain-containing protein [Candidatus Burarchaeum sp.]
MASKYTYYVLYLLIVILINLAWIAPPFLASSGNGAAAGVLYKGLSNFCHQLPQRSLCVIDAPDGSRSVGDCIVNWSTTETIDRYTYKDARGTGREFGVDARDNAIYLMMLIGGLIYPFVRRIGDDRTPPFWLFVLAILPLAIDGTTQLVGLRESTNLLRLATGTLAGFAVPFYAIPLMYYFIPVMKDAIAGKKAVAGKK